MIESPHKVVGDNFSFDQIIGRQALFLRMWAKYLNTKIRPPQAKFFSLFECILNTKSESLVVKSFRPPNSTQKHRLHNKMVRNGAILSLIQCHKVCWNHFSFSTVFLWRHLHEKNVNNRFGWLWKRCQTQDIQNRPQMVIFCPLSRPNEKLPDEICVDSVQNTILWRPILSAWCLFCF